jgi:hypothetical protein
VDRVSTRWIAALVAGLFIGLALLLCQSARVDAHAFATPREHSLAAELQTVCIDDCSAIDHCDSKTGRCCSSYGTPQATATNEQVRPCPLGMAASGVRPDDWLRVGLKLAPEPTPPRSRAIA